MYKFEMELGWMGDGKLLIETSDFDIIEILKDFVAFQESQSWIHNYEFHAIDDEDEDVSEDETTVVQ